jgi:hypothetical protein
MLAPMHGYETLSPIVREGYRLMVFENKVLRRMFLPKLEEETGGWRKLHMRSFKICTTLQILLK